MRTVRVQIRGRVQGVGFRWFARDEAMRGGVSGWVRNRRDGSVEAQLHGQDAAVDDILAALRRGPRSARVDAVEATEIRAEPPAGFDPSHAVIVPAPAYAGAGVRAIQSGSVMMPPRIRLMIVSWTTPRAIAAAGAQRARSRKSPARRARPRP